MTALPQRSPRRAQTVKVIVLFEGIHPSALEVLRQRGYQHIETHAKALAGEELRAALHGAHMVGIRPARN